MREPIVTCDFAGGGVQVICPYPSGFDDMLNTGFVVLYFILCPF